MIMKVLCVAIICSIIGLPHLYAASSLEISSGGGTVIDGSLQVCPGTTVSLTCSHDGVDLTRWRVTPPLPMDCDTVITHTASPNSEGLCGSFTISRISARTEQTRRSTIELLITESLDGAVVTCFAGASSTPDLQVRNLTIQINIGPPSTPTVDQIEYSVVDESTGQFTLLVCSNGTFGTGVIFFGSVVGGSGSVVVTDNSITVTGLNYTKSHTVSVVATSAVCPGVLNSSSIDFPVIFNIRTLVLTQLTGFVDCSNSSLPISGSWSAIEGVQRSSDSAVQLTPPLIDTPNITFTSAGGRSGNAEFVTNSSYMYHLANTVENDVYTFTVTVMNAANSSSEEVSAEIVDRALVIDDSTLQNMNCLTFSLGQNCASVRNGDFSIQFEQGSGTCRDLRPSEFSTSNIQLTSQSTCVPVTSSTNLCYRANLVYDGTIVDTQSNLNFNACPISVLDSFLADGVSMQLDGEVTNNTVSHLTTPTLSCTSAIFDLTNSPQLTCIDGTWEPAGLRSCTYSVWLIVVIILVILALACAIGIICGLLTARYFTFLLNGLAKKKYWATLVITLLVFVFCFGVGVLFYICCCKRDPEYKSKSDTVLAETRLSVPVAIYEELEDIPDPHTQCNLVYDRVQQSTDPRKPIYEDIKPDPHTQGNVAYGHVQFN